MGQPASGSGTLTVTSRWTLDDRANGDMTLIDYPLTRSFSVEGGKANLKVTVNEILSALSGIVVPGLL
jgi:hypothetical protein